MSRSGYTEYDGEDNWRLIMWRGAVASATRGKRGQRMFRDLKAALEAMPRKRLITDALENEGEVCALGALGQARGVDMSRLDPEEPDDVAQAFDIATCLAQEVAYENDEMLEGASPEQRWERMHRWVCAQIATEKPDSTERKP